MSGSPASADLITSLDVVVTPDPVGFRYEYTLSNTASSDLSVVSFALSIVSESDLQSITAPMGWTTSYVAGDASIAWESPDVLFDIQPGGLGVFSFLSVLGPVASDYLIVGLDESVPRIEFNEGQIAGPGASAVPEPSTMALVICGMVVLGIARTCRTRR